MALDAASVATLVTLKSNGTLSEAQFDAAIAQLAAAADDSAPKDVTTSFVKAEVKHKLLTCQTCKVPDTKRSARGACNNPECTTNLATPPAKKKRLDPKVTSPTTKLLLLGPAVEESSKKKRKLPRAFHIHYGPALAEVKVRADAQRKIVRAAYRELEILEEVIRGMEAAKEALYDDAAAADDDEEEVDDAPVVEDVSATAAAAEPSLVV